MKTITQELLTTRPQRDRMKDINYKRNTEFERQIYSVINKIIQAPGLYIGKKSVNKLSTFLCGYCFAYIEIYHYQPHFDREFQTFVEERSESEGVAHWDTIISVDRNEEESFDYFVELFRHFVEQ